MFGGSVARGEEPLERDAEIEHEVGHHVVVCLTAAHVGDRLGDDPQRVGPTDRVDDLNAYPDSISLWQTPHEDSLQIHLNRNSGPRVSVS